MKHSTGEHFMKTAIALAILAFTFGSYANETIRCLNASEPGLSYVLTEIDYDHYDLKISKKELVLDSCRTRWGCDYKEEIILTDKLIMRDYQGAMVFKSRRSYINMEDFDNADASYTIKGPTGKFEKKFVILKCAY